MFFDLGKRLKGLLQVLTYIITFFACMIGTVSGMGGGIIIKPVLDATGHMSVAAVTFLSGVTVIMMTIWTLGKTIVLRESVLSARNTTLLAISAAVGGLFGKQAYSMTVALFPTPNMAGGIPVNCSDDRTRCDFYFPGIAEGGGVTAGVTVGGTDHRLAREATERIRKCLAEI